MPLKSHVTNKSSYQSNKKGDNFMDYLTLTNNTKMPLIEMNEIKNLDKNKTYFPWTEAF